MKPKDKQLPQWHPGAQIRKGHPEDAAVEVDCRKTREYEKQQEPARKGKP